MSLWGRQSCLEPDLYPLCELDHDLGHHPSGLYSHTLPSPEALLIYYSCRALEGKGARAFLSYHSKTATLWGGRLSASVWQVYEISGWLLCGQVPYLSV